MADSKFWRKLAKKIRDLDPDGSLGLVWPQSIDTKRYYFAFLHHKSDESIQARFDVLAVSGGQKIDPSAPNPRNAWLTAITKMGRYKRVVKVLQFEPGADRQSLHNTAELNHICEVSATLCYRFQKQALEDEGSATPPKVPAEAVLMPTAPPDKHAVTGLSNDGEMAASADNSKTPAPENSPPQVSTGKKRERRPNQERRSAIHSAVSKRGDVWREHLEEIFTELDNENVPLGDFQGMTIDLGEGKNDRAWTWTDLGLAEGKQRDQIIDALRKYAD